MDELPEKPASSDKVDESNENSKMDSLNIPDTSIKNPVKIVESDENNVTGVGKPNSSNMEMEIIIKKEDDIKDGSITEMESTSAPPSPRKSITVIHMSHNVDASESDETIYEYKDAEISPHEVMAKINKPKKGRKVKTNLTYSPKKCDINTGDQEESDSAFSVGSRVEAKDFGEIWHAARIMEVDSDEMEVLVHYDEWTQRNDEWINVSSPRVRSLNDAPVLPSPSLSDIKIPIDYKVGERCFARWSNNRRFPATVRAIVENGKYEIIFDDGISRVCQWYYLSKMKTKQSASVTSDSSITTTPSPPPDRAADASPVPPDPAPIPFHRHLFDPSLDYLGPKSERREMKKKLDVKTLFNIGKRTTTKSTNRKRTIPIERSRTVKKKRGRKKKNSLNVIVADKASVESPKQEVEAIIKDEIKNETEEEIKLQNVHGTTDAKSMLLDTSCTQLTELTTEKSEDEPVSDSNTSNKVLNELQEDNGASNDAHVDSVNKQVLDETVIHESQDNEKDTLLEVDTDTTDPEKPTRDSTPIPKTTTRQNSNSNTSSRDAISTETELIEEAPKEVPKLEESNNVPEEVIKTKIGNSAEEHTDNVDSSVEDNLSIEMNIDTVGTDSSSDNKTEDIIVREVIIDCPAPATDVSHTTPNYEANIPLEDIQVEYGMDIDEGLKLIAEAVESFEAEQAVKSELKLEVPVSDAPASDSVKTETQMPERYEATLEEGKWCCRWVNGEPQGVLFEMDTDTPVKGATIVLPRKSVLVEDKRLPPDWKKILVRRCYGHSAGKWDVVLIDPSNRRLRDKGEIRNYMSLHKNEELRKYENALMDFSVHRKLARRLGWDTTTPEGAYDSVSTLLPLVGPTIPSMTPKIRLKLKKKAAAYIPTSDGPPPKKKKRRVPVTPVDVGAAMIPTPANYVPPLTDPATLPPEFPSGDGFAYVGSIKVEIIENLFRCPADACFKNFRKDNLLRMHIKHYHRELRKFLGSTPKVSDLAYARTAIPEDTIIPKLKCEGESKTPKLKASPKTPTAEKVDKRDVVGAELYVETAQDDGAAIKTETTDKLAALQDSPKLRIALENLSTKRPKVLYPVKKSEIKSEQASPRSDAQGGSKLKEDMHAFVKIQKLPDRDSPDPFKIKSQHLEHLDFEAAISTHTVTKPAYWKRKPKNLKKSKAARLDVLKVDKKKKKSTGPKWTPTEDLWELSDPETRSSYGAVDSRTTDRKTEVPMLPVPETINRDPDFLISETGERIKIEHMKREEIINCHCGFGEEDGLMIQCDLCLCWQHAICHSYDTNTVPDKYTCSICLNPRRGRASRRFLHEQTWLYEGALPGGAADAALRRAHELTGNLLRLSHVLHTLRLKYHVATKKDHPKLYLWAKDWENAAHLDGVAHEKVVTEHLNHVDLNDMFREIGKENLPLKDVSIGDKTPPSEDVGEDKHYDSQKDDSQLGSQVLLANLLSSPSGASLDLPISTSELERLAKSVQESEAAVVRGGPEPEAPIESGACRKHLLRHIQRCQALIDARLDSIEAQVAELESQDPSFEDDETAEYFPRTKQTIQMLHRDLDALEELGIIT